MGSHYIPVGKLKIDKDLLDIACPAAGYTPEIICPAAGWLPPEPDGTWEPPLFVPDPSEEEIILLVKADTLACLRFIVQGNYRVLVYTEEMVLVYSADQNSNSNFQYNLPQTSPGAFYIVKITNRAGSLLTSFRLSGITAYPIEYMYVFQAKFNTPNIITLSSAFQNISTLRDVKFYSTLNFLTSFNSFISRTGVGKFVMPSSLLSVTTLANFADGSELITFDFNNAYLPLCTNMTYILANNGSLKILNFNPVAPLVNNLSYAISGCILLKSVKFDFTITNHGNIINATFLANNCSSLETLELWVNQLTSNVVSINSLALGCGQLRKVIYRGYFLVNTSSHAAFSSSANPKLAEVICADDMEFTQTSIGYLNISSLKKLVLPKNTIIGSTLAISNMQPKGLELIENNPISIEQIGFIIRSPFIKQINLPNVKTSGTLLVGVPGGLLEYFEINWENSNYTSVATNITIAGNMSAVQIDRIFSRLPIVSSAEKIDVTSNPGYATCNKAIATAKGWTVL